MSEPLSPNGSRYCNFLLSPRVLGQDTLQTLLETVLVIPLVPLNVHLFVIEPSTVLQCTHPFQEIN